MSTNPNFKRTGQDDRGKAIGQQPPSNQPTRWRPEVRARHGHPSDKVLTINIVAKRLGVSVSEVRRLTQAGKLPYIICGEIGKEAAEIRFLATEVAKLRNTSGTAPTRRDDQPEGESQDSRDRGTIDISLTAPDHARSMATTVVLDQEVRSRITSFVEELSALVRRAALESVRTALGVGAVATRGPRASRGPRMASAAGGKRSSGQIEGQLTKFLDYVKKNPGKRMEEIVQAIGSSTKHLRLPVRKLLDAKKVKTKGNKRGTTYFATSE